MKALEYAGPLMKMGRKSKLWITRWHVLSNHTMYIYDTDSSRQPKHIVFLRGLFFTKCREKNLVGIHLFSDSNNFKERWMYHKDEKEIEVWMQYLSQQCQFF